MSPSSITVCRVCNSHRVALLGTFSDVPLPDGAPWLMTLGQLTADHGFRDAVWAFDVLKFVYPDIHLVIVGDGPERDRLVHFSHRLGGHDIRTHFVRAHPSAALWMQQATVE